MRGQAGGQQWSSPSRSHVICCSHTQIVGSRVHLALASEIRGQMGVATLFICIQYTPCRGTTAFSFFFFKSLNVNGRYLNHLIAVQLGVVGLSLKL